MKKLFSGIGIALFIFVGITGGLISNKEHIPDNAKILVIEEYHTWIPDANWANEIFLEQSVEDLNTKTSYENAIRSRYLEIKKGKYKGFQLPESWTEMDGGARIIWGKDESLLRSLIFPKENRWNIDGSWNW